MAIELTGTGIPLLLVHGFPLTLKMWDQQVDSLSQVCRVIRFNLPGFGDASQRTEQETNRLGSASTDSYSMATLADSCAAKLDEVGVRGPIVFCGLSMGGYVAFEFWRRHRSRLAALILCDTKATADTTDAAQTRRQVAQKALSEGTEAAVRPMLERLVGSTTRAQRPSVIEAVRSMMFATAPQTIFAAQNAMSVRNDFSRDLSRIDVPCHLIVGQEDVISTPEEMMKMAQEIPNATIDVIPQSGHLPNMETPTPFNASVRTFIARLDPTLFDLR